MTNDFAKSLREKSFGLIQKHDRRKNRSIHIWTKNNYKQYLLNAFFNVAVTEMGKSSATRPPQFSRFIYFYSSSLT